MIDINEFSLSEEEKEERYNAMGSELSKDKKWLFNISKSQRIPENQTEKLLIQFLRNIYADQDYFKNIKEVRKHFRNWIPREMKRM